MHIIYIYPHGYNSFAGGYMKKITDTVDKILDFGGITKSIIFLAVSGIFLLNSILDILPLPFDGAWIAIILCGLPIVIEAILGLITEFNIKAGVLVSIALVASILIDEIFAAGEVAFIMQLGELLEHLTVKKARSGIEKLIRLTPKTARVIKDGNEHTIPAEKVLIDDILRVLPGESIPVDGVITEGSTSVDEAVITGESLPCDKAVGDEVCAGSINRFGSFEMRASKVGEDSTLSRMIKLVRSADAEKAEIVRYADKWATWIVIFALLASAFAWIFTKDIIRAVTILVVFCPCALVLATPTAIVAAIGNAAKHGLLVKEGDALERLSKADTLAFDKTGTLTYGRPEVINVTSVSDKYDRNAVFALAASIEKLSEHPLGKAVVKAYIKNDDNCKFLDVSDFSMIPGKGISAVVDGNKILACNKAFLQENGVEINEAVRIQTDKFSDIGASVIYLSQENELVGFVALSDTLREKSNDMIASVKKLKVFPILITGDNEKAASAIAERVGISKFYAACLPEDKLSRIDEIEKQGGVVCMVGDGVNDAPALKKAQVGIAMGGIGSDIAIEASDITVADDKVEEIPHLLSLSKKMMKTIKLNMIFSMSLNLAAIILAMTGILNPVAGAIVHNAGSVAVIINSALLMMWKKR